VIKKPDPEQLISFLEKKRVAKFKGCGIEVEFFPELPEITFPEPQQNDAEATKQYLEGVR
tara:strand:- start:464 stop:643 length:180 start_codon:yes stop_codon:yes gene_type:complete